MLRSINPGGCAAVILLGLTLALGAGCTDSTDPGTENAASPSKASWNPGSIRIVLTTTGTNPDSDGYELTIDDTVHLAMTVNDTLSLSHVTPTRHTFQLLGFALNCATDSAQRQISLKSAEDKLITYSISCVGRSIPPDLAGTQLLFVRQHRIYRTSIGDDASVVAIGDGDEPTWSPDGRRIAFARSGDIYVMDADGGNVRQVAVTEPLDDLDYDRGRYAPAWSPDGGRLAVHSGTGIVIIPVDSIATPTRLAYPDSGGILGSPTWSPDGTQVAFMMDIYPLWDPNAWGNGQVGLFVGDVSGAKLSNIKDLTQHSPSYAYAQPAWSPDGRRIAFVACPMHAKCSDAAIGVMNADGSQMRIVTSTTGFARPAWTSDSQTIIYASTCWDRDCPSMVLYVSTDGTRRGMLMDDAHSPSWRK